MARVEWQRDARRDLERVVAFLWEKQPGAAARAAQLILDGADLLVSSPRLGRPIGDGTDRRDLTLPFGSGAYILRYMLLEEDTVVVVIRVRHSREDRSK